MCRRTVDFQKFYPTCHNHKRPQLIILRKITQFKVDWNLYNNNPKSCHLHHIHITIQYIYIPIREFILSPGLIFSTPVRIFENRALRYPYFVGFVSHKDWNICDKFYSDTNIYFMSSQNNYIPSPELRLLGIIREFRNESKNTLLDGLIIYCHLWLKLLPVFIHSKSG